MLHKIRVLALCAGMFVTACSTPTSHTAVTPESDGELMASSSEASAEPEEAAVAQDDPIVCKRITQTGTRVAQRICRRQSQIDKSRRDAQEMLNEVQKRGVLATESEQ